MADKEIGSLSAATLPLGGTELIHVVQGGNSRKATTADIPKPVATTSAAGITELAVASEYRANTAGNLSLTPAEVWAAAACSPLSDAATITVDFSAGFDFGGASNAVLGLGGNRTLGAPSNVKSGQKGILWFGAVTSTRTLTLDAAWVLCTGVEAGPYSILTTGLLGVCYATRGTTTYVTAIVRVG